MDLFSSAVVKRYERILRENPKSPAFCPLAEIYRMRKETAAAEKLCLQGLKRRPRHYGGRIVLARIYRDKNRLPEALQQLSRAKGLDPENPLAYELTGEICLQQKDSAAALQNYKMVLFLNPWNRFAAQIVRQSEAGAADGTAGPAKDASAARASAASAARPRSLSGKKEEKKPGASHTTERDDSKDALSFSKFFPWDPFFFEKESERQRGEALDPAKDPAADPAARSGDFPTGKKRKKAVGEGNRAPGGFPPLRPSSGQAPAPLPEEAPLSDLSKRQRLRVLQKLLSYIEGQINKS